MELDRRLVREDPRPGDICGYWLQSNAPIRREVIEVVNRSSPGCTDTERRKNTFVTYWNAHGKMKTCTLAAWREWAHVATIVKKAPDE